MENLRMPLLNFIFKIIYIIHKILKIICFFKEYKKFYFFKKHNFFHKI